MLKRQLKMLQIPNCKAVYIYTNGIPDDSTDKGKAINTYLKYILVNGQEIVPLDLLNIFS